jgi:hypothetical protein
MEKNITAKSGILAHDENTVLGKNIIMHVYQHTASTLLRYRSNVITA